MSHPYNNLQGWIAILIDIIAAMSTVMHSSMLFLITLQSFSFFNTILQQTGLVKMVSTENYK